MPTSTLDISSSSQSEIGSQGAFDELLQQLEQENLPDWLMEAKRRAWNRFLELPMPHRKDEHWRFSTIDRNLLKGFRLGGSPSESDAFSLAKIPSFNKEAAGEMAFADGEQILLNPVSTELSDKGVLFMPMIEALANHGELIRRYFYRQGQDLGSAKFIALHQALFRTGTFVYVPKNVVVEEPLLAAHWLVNENTAVFPKTLIIAEENSKVNLVELFRSAAPSRPGFSASKSQIFAGPNSEVFRKVVQDWNEKTISFQDDSTFAERDARVKNVAVNIGAKKARYENQVRIDGAGADVKLYSLTIADRDQEFDQRTLQVHAAPNATSDLLFKNALLDQSRTIFSGLILVDERGQQTDAYQTNRNLLLDSTAEANSLPGLEIQANDVKCSHGATTSNLDPDDLFYLLSRGIPSRIAKELLVFGFFEEIIQKFENPSMADNVRHLVQNKFNRHIDS